MISRATASQNFIKNNRASVRLLGVKLVSESEDSDDNDNDSNIRKSIARQSIANNRLSSKNINASNYDLEEGEIEEEIQINYWKKINIKYGDTIRLLFKLSWVAMFYMGGYFFYSYYEGWTFLESMYFITQTVSTVGYGDLSPQTKTGRVFTVGYIFLGIMLVFSIINNVLYYFIGSVKPSRPTKRTKTAIIVRKTAQVCLWFIMLFTLLIIGAFAFSYLEGWTFEDAFYFSAYTSSSVGYGDMGLTNKSSIIFNIFYILISVSLTVSAINNASTLGMRIEEADLHQKLDKLPLTVDLLDAISENANTSDIRRSDYVLYMLLLSGTIDQARDVEHWVGRFKDYDMNKNGIIDMNDIYLYQKWHQNYTTNKQELLDKTMCGKTMHILKEVIDTLLILFHLKRNKEDHHSERPQSMNLRMNVTSFVQNAKRRKSSLTEIKKGSFIKSERDNLNKSSRKKQINNSNNKDINQRNNNNNNNNNNNTDDSDEDSYYNKKSNSKNQGNLKNNVNKVPFAINDDSDNNSDNNNNDEQDNITRKNTIDNTFKTSENTLGTASRINHWWNEEKFDQNILDRSQVISMRVSPDQSILHRSLDAPLDRPKVISVRMRSPSDEISNINNIRKNPVSSHVSYYDDDSYVYPPPPPRERPKSQKKSANSIRLKNMELLQKQQNKQNFNSNPINILTHKSSENKIETGSEKYQYYSKSPDQISGENPLRSSPTNEPGFRILSNKSINRKSKKVESSRK